MANPSGSRNQAAYARAMAAFQEGEFEAAKRLAIEILTEDPGHAGARALRTRIDARLGAGRAVPTPTPGAGRSPAYSSRGNVPEATSVDPTMLIEHADRQAPDYIEPTVIAQRADFQRPRTQRDPAPPPPAPGRAAESVSQPTVLISPKNRTGSASRSGRQSGSMLQGWLKRSSPGREPARPSRQSGTGFWTPVTRGIVMAVGGLIVASIFVLGAVAIGRWLSTDSYALTFQKPNGGTIKGAGLTCGTQGDDCSITVKSGQAVDLETVADEKFVFSAYTGDCPSSGRFTMTQARSCGARFEGSVPLASGTFPLTITKPSGGTILVAGGIVCGTAGDTCSMNLPTGAPVTIVAEPDSGHKFVSYTGDCEMNGETTMTGARNCGSTFIKVEGGEAQNTRDNTRDSNPPPPPRVRSQPPAPPPPGPSGQTAKPTVTSPAPPPTGSAAPAQTPPTPAPVTVVAPTVTPEAQAKPVTPVDSELEHAKKEIDGLVRKYCSALQTLDAGKVQAVFPRANMEALKSQFKNYKSLKCTVGDKLDFERIDVAGAGGSQLKFDMKQAMVMKVGGAPPATELVVTMRVARRNAQEPWTIDWVESEPKPK